jgi:hypothetical protein
VAAASQAHVVVGMFLLAFFGLIKSTNGWYANTNYKKYWLFDKF